MWLDFEQHRAAAYALDGLRNTHPVYVDVGTPDEATENFDVITYEKGASVVRMLERWLGPPVFRRGVRRYIRRHRESNARAADLWRALEETSGQPVEPVVRAWIERPGFPLLSVSRADRGGRAQLVVAQERFFSSPRDPAEARSTRWPIPAVIRVQPSQGRARLDRALIETRRARLDLGPADRVRWAYANADESGFYRPVHASALLAALGDDLRHLPPAERIGLIGHQWAGFRAARAELSDLLGLVTRLSSETQHEILTSLATPLGWLEDQALPALRADLAARFRSWLAGTFGPAFGALGWDARRGEDNDVRQRRAALLALVGGLAEEPGVLAEADERIEAYLRDRRTLDPNLAGPLVDLAARHGDRSRHQAYRRSMRRASTPQEHTRFEMALAAFRDPDLVEHTLALALTDEVLTQDVVPLLARLLANPAARERTWEFVRERWEELSPRLSPGLAPRLIGALPALQKPLYRRQVAAFFRAHPIPTAARALRQALERFDLDAELRSRAVPALRHWLRQQASR
jgi:puromycin-sensitive aminopeptidase